MGLIWGASFLFIKIGLGGLSFGQVAWTRVLLGALALGVIVLVTRQRLPREPIVYLHFLVIGLTYCVIPHLLFAWAEQYVTSGLASIYNATTPIMTALMATLVFRVERLQRDQVLGIAVGIVGVVVIVGPWRSLLAGDLLGQLACLGATLCYGFSFAYARRFVSFRPISGTSYAFLNIGMAGLVMIALTPVIAIAPLHLDGWIVASLLVLGILGTGVAYIWNVNVLRAWGPTAASTVTYVTPVVGVALGILVLGEVLSWNEPAGAALVLVGILLAQGRLRARRRGAGDDGSTAPGAAKEPPTREGPAAEATGPSITH
jgi:drug/metabolite transporter (DMT)-like permease